MPATPPQRPISSTSIPLTSTKSLCCHTILHPVSTSIYSINKGINKPIEFRGLKAQYIWYLGGGLLALLILFAILYISGVNTFVCLGLIICLGAGLFVYVYGLSHKYGEYGMMKKMARKGIPKVICVRSRKMFVQGFIR
jgi:hypothetical protein